jgi:hypothetical protein
MRYGTESVNNACRRLARLVDRIKLAAPGSNQRRKVKRFQNLATSLARSYRVAKRELGHTKYDATYKAKAVRSMLRRL